MAYHHGDARAALLAAAAAMLETEGAAGLSLRQVAERAGLSRQAPYNHFANKEAMLAEVAADGFRTLRARMAAIGAAASPIERLSAAADAYIGFGTERPATFRLMFARELVDIRSHAGAKADADAAMALLAAIVSEVVPPAVVGDATLVAWSLVHGYTELCIEAGIEGADKRAARASLFARTVAAVA
ncbi:TetR/AcrR family transcriptional regulator [Sphingomonas adhaesiva]|uniref:TetR/AcrR family transcriptional regulator n=1 Tax=Sphingomonas adhaesiva TaxID=28212 RepID=UPI002FF7A7E2